MKQNLSYEIKEVENNNLLETDLSEIITNFESLSDNSDSNEEDLVMDNYVALEIFYRENMNFKDLQKICDYYEISRRKLKKDELIQEIVLFECDPNNEEIVSQRKLHWFYISELKKDKFLKKFILFD